MRNKLKRKYTKHCVRRNVAKTIIDRCDKLCHELTEKFGQNIFFTIYDELADPLVWAYFLQEEIGNTIKERRRLR